MLYCESSNLFLRRPQAMKLIIHRFVNKNPVFSIIWRVCVSLCVCAPERLCNFVNRWKVHEKPPFLDPFLYTRISTIACVHTITLQNLVLKDYSLHSLSTNLWSRVRGILKTSFVCSYVLYNFWGVLDE